MARRQATKPATPATAPKSWRNLFRSRRQTIWFSFFALYFALTVAQLGLVSQQIHKRPHEVQYWPGQETMNVFGLLLFTCLVSLLFSIFHWAANLGVYMVVFFALGIFWGVGAGVIYPTPFGHGLQCGRAIDTFPANFQPLYSDCSRWTAVEGLAWSLFGLSVIGFFATLHDRFEMHVKRNQVYDLEIHDEEKAAINRAPSASGSHVESH